MESMDITEAIMAKMQNKRQVLCVLAAIVCCMSCFVGCGKGSSQSSESESSKTEQSMESAENSESEQLKGGKILWGGHVYEYNDHLSNYIFIGVDKEELVDTNVGSANAGQADALFLLSWDRVTGDVTVITIPRDTITTINTYGRDGTDMGPVEQQINLAYGFGDGKHKSCQFVKDAVSNLFYRIPIQGYCAVTLDALEEMGTILGDITVTVPNDSLVKKAPEMTVGAEVVIGAENLELFVRYRDIEVTNSALYRIERQHAFMKGCYENVLARFDKNPGIVADLYTGLSTYMVTNIGNDQFFKIMEGLAEGGNMTQWTVPGEGVATDTFDEYHVDEDALFDMVLKSFFEEDN